MGSNLFLKNTFFWGRKIEILVTQITQKKRKVKKRRKGSEIHRKYFFGKNGLKSPYFMDFFWGGNLPDLDN
jgi:hypothetical protein